MVNTMLRPFLAQWQTWLVSLAILFGVILLPRVAHYGRVLLIASDAGKAWDLRCYVRENLIKFLQQRNRESLPKVRAEFHGLAAGNHIPEPAALHSPLIVARASQQARCTALRGC